MVVAHVEAWWRGLAVVSIATRANRVRGNAAVPCLGHRVRHMVGGVWVH